MTYLELENQFSSYMKWTTDVCHAMDEIGERLQALSDCVIQKQHEHENSTEQIACANSLFDEIRKRDSLVSAKLKVFIKNTEELRKSLIEYFKGVTIKYDQICTTYKGNKNLTESVFDPVVSIERMGDWSCFIGEDGCFRPFRISEYIKICPLSTNAMSVDKLLTEELRKQIEVLNDICKVISDVVPISEDQLWNCLKRSSKVQEIIKKIFIMGDMPDGATPVDDYCGWIDNTYSELKYIKENIIQIASKIYLNLVNNAKVFDQAILKYENAEELLNVQDNTESEIV